MREGIRYIACLFSYRTDQRYFVKGFLQYAGKLPLALRPPPPPPHTHTPENTVGQLIETGIHVHTSLHKRFSAGRSC